MAERFLITGGAGFIGSHLAQHLLSLGHTVVALDNLSTGRIENIQPLLGHKNFQFVRDTVENETTVNHLVAGASHVFHLASAVGVQLIVDEPVRTIRTIVRGTEIVLEAAFRFNRPVLITSSSEVYGKGARVPFCEEDDVVMGPTHHARWCYAYAKGIDEFLGLAYHRQYGLPVTIVRLFNTVGPRQVGMYGMVLPRFAKAALQGLPLQVFGTGEQTRCFAHVNDIVGAITRLIAHQQAHGNVFNLGGEEEISINDLARRVIAAAGSTSTIEHISYEQAYGQPFDDLSRRVPSLDKVRALIGYQPTHNLDDIITAVIAQYR
ncbi:MAG: GDP-mannose 4,6-dehydratase [Phycisphaerales bacterium]|nr:GDP-mannose 4,6-dehydratase [Phycisphaerales bacterium]